MARGDDQLEVERVARLEALVEQLVYLEHGRQARIDAEWAAIPFYWEESAYNAALGANTALTTQPTTSELVVVEHVLATVPANQTGLVQLGDVVVPVGQGLNSFSCKKLLTTTDARSVTATGAGPVAISLFGHLAPTRGKVT